MRETEPQRPRWVWDDTASWYAPLLAAGVRVERCVDLHLCRRILRRSPLVDPALLAGPAERGLGRLGGAGAGARADPVRRRHPPAP